MTWMQYPDQVGTVSRDVRVEGYATFDVVSGGVFPFRVYAGGFEIEGDGKFTVDNLYPGRPVAVWVTRGAVRILTHELDTPTTVPAGHVAHVTSAYIQVDTGTVHRALRRSRPDRRSGAGARLRSRCPGAVSVPHE